MDPNATSCIQGNPPGVPILANRTESRLCGIRASNASIISPCCADGQVFSSLCVQFCATNPSLQTFWRCANDHKGDVRLESSDAFCMTGVQSRNTKTLSKTSTGVSSATKPHLGWWMVILVLCLCITGSFGSSDHASLARRQSSSSGSCDVTPGTTLTRPGTTFRVTSNYGCDAAEGEYCEETRRIETWSIQNNRTINGASASSTEYDAFFDALANKTGRSFPALSSVVLDYEFMVGKGMWYIDFSPFQWCINVLVSNCPGINATDVQACGPLFVADTDGKAVNEDSKMLLQGVLQVKMVQA